MNTAILEAEASRHPYPLLFATVSGAHLYGFPSPDSDYDLRGAHVLPVEDVVGLAEPRETIEFSGVRDGIEMDLVTHDARKFFELMLKRNGYVLEQLYSPLVVRTSPEHEELKRLGRGCLTRYHSHHYLGFAATQWKLFEKEQPRRVKPLLYVYRVLLTGIHLMRSGEIEANLVTLNDRFRLGGFRNCWRGNWAGRSSRQSKMPALSFTGSNTRGWWQSSKRRARSRRWRRLRARVRR